MNLEKRIADLEAELQNQQGNLKTCSCNSRVCKVDKSEHRLD